MEETRKYELGPRDFDNFRIAAQEWINKLSLHDWEVDYTFETCDDNAEAKCLVNREARRATILLSDRWYNEEPTPERVQEVALHEVLELLIDDLWFVFADEINENERKRAEMTRANHAIIHRLQRVLIHGV